MMWVAVDSAGHPDPQAIKDSGALFVAQYVGTQYQAYGISKAQLDGYYAAGVSVGLIFEETESQFRGGEAAARGMISRMLQGCDTLEVTPGVDFLPLVAIVDPRPGDVYGYEDQLQYFAQTIDALLGCEWTGYGSKYGLDLAAQVAPHMTRKWGVRTWGYTDAFNVGIDMIQEPNVASPIVGTDYNTVFNVDMGQWPRPKPTTRKDREMLFSVDTVNFFYLDVDYGMIPVPVAHDFSWCQIDQATFDKLNLRPTRGGAGTSSAVGKITGSLTIAP